MAITNQERVGKAKELLRQGLGPLVEREFRNLHKAKTGAEALRYMGDLAAPSDARQAGDRAL